MGVTVVGLGVGSSQVLDLLLLDVLDLPLFDVDLPLFELLEDLLLFEDEDLLLFEEPEVGHVHDLLLFEE